MQNECPNTDMVFGQSKNRGGVESAPFGTWAYIWFFVIQIMHIWYEMMLAFIWDQKFMIWMTKSK